VDFVVMWYYEAADHWCLNEELLAQMRIAAMQKTIEAQIATEVYEKAALRLWEGRIRDKVGYFSTSAPKVVRLRGEEVEARWLSMETWNDEDSPVVHVGKRLASGKGFRKEDEKIPVEEFVRGVSA
jgi:hypothetical protein